MPLRARNNGAPAEIRPAESDRLRAGLMLASMQFTRAHLEDILATGWPAAARLVGWARALIGAAVGSVPRPLALEIRRILRPAESLIRRLVVIMACRIVAESPSPLTKPAWRATGQSSGRSASEPLQPSGPGRLSLVEPFPVCFRDAPRRGPPACPSIWSPGRVRYTPPPPQEKPIPVESLLSHLSKLESVLADPGAQARRVALWIARRRGASRPIRTFPIRPWGLTPGQGSAALDRLTDNRLLYVSQAAQAALTLDIWNSS